MQLSPGAPPSTRYSGLLIEYYSTAQFINAVKNMAAQFYLYPKLITTTPTKLYLKAGR